MSNLIAALAQRRVMGSPTKKAVIMYLADRASDDGSGIWCSKANMSRDTEYSKRTVQKAINEMAELGILVEVGTRKCVNGFTVEYSIIVPALKALESTRKSDDLTGVTDSPLNSTGVTGSPDGCHTFTPQVSHVHVTGVTDSPKPSFNHPSTDLEPSNAILEFEGFWKLYPRKVGIAPARKAFAKARKIASLEQIIDGLCILVEAKAGSEKQFIPHPATWLNREGWLERFEDLKNAPMTTADRIRDLSAPARASDLFTSIEDMTGGPDGSLDTD